MNTHILSHYVSVDDRHCSFSVLPAGKYSIQSMENIEKMPKLTLNYVLLLLLQTVFFRQLLLKLQ